MESKPLIIGIVAGLLVGLTLGYAITIPKISEYEKQITALENEKVNLQTQVSQLTHYREEANIQLDTLKTLIYNLTNEKTTLQNQLTQLQQTDLYLTIATRDAEIAQLSQQIAEKSTQIMTLQSQVNLLQAKNLELIDVSFSRVDDTSSLIRTWIGKANSTIDVAIYSFTQNSIGDALVAAKGRGVNVRVIMEQDTISDSGSEYSWLQSKGIAIRTDSSEGLMHDKFFIIDGKVIGTGSYNWTTAAENDNSENLLIVRSESLATKYLNEFNYLWSS